MAAETALVAQAGDAHHHRIAVLAVGEELQRAGLAADLVAGVVEVGEVLDLRQRQHAEVGIALGKTEDHGLVEQGVEHPRRAEGLVQALRHRVDAALLRHVLAEQQGFRVLGEQVVQGLVDLDGEMARRLLLGQLRLAAEGLQAGLGIVVAGGLAVDDIGMAGRQRRHHLVQRGELRPAIGFLGGGEAPGADRFVELQHPGLRHQARHQRDLRRAQQGVAGLHPHQFLDGPPFDLEVGAGVAHDPGGLEMQEGRAPRAPAVLDGGGHLPVAGGEIEAVGEEVVEAVHGAEALGDPARGRLHRDADAIVLADEQHRRRQALVRRPGRGIEGRLRRGVVGRGITEGADRDRILGDRQGMADAPRLPDGDGGAERLRQVAGDRRGLRQHPQRLAAPDLVPPSRGRSSLLAAKESAESMIGSMPGSLRKRSAMKPPER
jgi:hypothetical protein